MRTTNPAKCKSIEVTEKVIFPDATEQTTAYDIFNKFREFIPWVSLDGFTIGGDTGYAVTPVGSSVALQTGVTADYDAFLYSTAEWNNLLDVGKKITVEFIITSRLLNAANQTIWLRMSVSHVDPPSETANHFGWKIVNADLSASNADGTTQTITDTTVDVAAGVQRTRLKMVLNPGTDCKFYVNDVLKVTHTTNLPTSTLYFLHFHIRTGEAEAKYLWLGRVLIEKEN